MIAAIILKFEHGSLHTALHPKDVEEMTNSVDPAQSVPIAV